MNILFCYRYRDASNYKQYNEIVFSNPLNRKLKEIELFIEEKLIDGLWFIAADWNIPNQFFKEYVWNNEVDHEWHEFDKIQETLANVTEKNSIEDLLSLIKTSKAPKL